LERDIIFSPDRGSSPKNTRTLFPATVQDIDDPADAWRIKCKIQDLRDDMLEELPYCYPLLGKQMGGLPKVGETVWVMLGDLSRPTGDRFWFPRVFSQYQNINEEYGVENTTKGTIHSRLDFEKSITRVTTAKGLYPDKSNQKRTWLIGRNNADMYFDDNLAVLRVGKHKIDKFTERNQTNPAYLRLEYNKEGETTSILTANKLMFVSQSVLPKPNIDLDEDKLEELFAQLSPLPKGDILVEVLNVFRKALLTHSHKYFNLPPDFDNINVQKLRDDNLTRIYSNNIKIN